MINFDNPDTPHGWYYFIMRDHRRGSWWTIRHGDLGASPLSALCDDRFEDVHRTLDSELASVLEYVYG